MALLSYSIASGIPVTLTCVKCWNINHRNHKHTYSHEPHDQNDKSNRCHTLYDCDDWYFSIWHVSMSLEFHWQLSNWVGLLRRTKPDETGKLSSMCHLMCHSMALLSYSIASGIPVTLTCVKCWNISHYSHIRYYIY